MSAGSRSATRRRRGPTKRALRPPPPWPPWYRRRRSQAVGAAVLIAVTAAVVVTAATSSRSGHHTTSTVTSTPSTGSAAQEWLASVDHDLSPISGVLISLVATAQSWPAGKTTPSAVAAQIVSDLPLFAQTLRNLSGQAPLPSAPTAKALSIDSIDLYVAALQIERAAAGLPPSALQQQLQRSFERTRELGDRVYDLASTLALGGTPPAPSMKTARPADVPDWAALGLAAGPPLAAAPPAAATTPPTYQVTRPQQPLSGWLSAVARSGAPSASLEQQAMTSGGAGALGQLADQAQAAVSRLTSTSDPAGDRAASTTTRLSLLVIAEALRATEASRLVSSPAQVQSSLEAAGQVLADIADQLWAAQVLGPRRTGFSAALLDPATITAVS